MRNVIITLIVIVFFSSCGQNDTKQKELKLKEKELALKQRELELKEKGVKTDSNSVNTQVIQKTNSNTITTGIYTVKSDKSYFYNAADPTTIRNGYILKGDIINIQKVDGDYAYGIYSNSSGAQISGWLLSTDLEKSPNASKPNKILKAEFLVKNNSLIFLVNKKEFVIEKGFGSGELKQENEPNKLAVASSYGGSGWTTYSATLQKSGDIKIEETLFYRVNAELQTESRVMLKVKSGDY